MHSKRSLAWVVGLLAGFLLIGPSSIATAQSDSYYPETIRQGWGPRCLTRTAGPFRLAAGVGTDLQGVGATLGDINGNARPDLLLMGLRNPPQQNEFRYRILWDIDATGASSSPPSPPVSVSGLGWEAQGAGAALTDLDGNDRPELLLMAYDNPAGLNEFRYKVGWNLDAAGKAASWSQTMTFAGFGDPADAILGAGLAIGFVDSNNSPDMVLTAVGATMQYQIGFNIGGNGIPAVWSTAVNVPRMPGSHMGSDAILADIDLDGTTDILIGAFAKGEGTGAGGFYYRVGWSLSSTGIPAYWSRVFRLSGFGTAAGGLGLAHVNEATLGPILIVADHKDNGSDEFDDVFRYNALPLTTSGTAFGAASDPPPKTTNALQVPTGTGDATAEKLFNLNMSLVRSVASDAVMTFWFNSVFPAADNWHDYPDQTGNFALMLSRARAELAVTPDFAVAAVAWYVDHTMGYTHDAPSGPNDYVLNTYHGLGYALKDSEIPAYFTARYTNPYLPANAGLIAALKAKNPDWAKVYNRGFSYHGDCEDYAIFRHALLRALGFDRRFIWNVESPSHVHNVVLYNGALRIMDYGPIQRYLCCASGINNMIFQGWNSDFGSVYTSDAQQIFWHQIAPRALPDVCGETGWLFSRHARSERAGDCVTNCK
jgi:hypothetical protein